MNPHGRGATLPPRCDERHLSGLSTCFTLIAAASAASAATLQVGPGKTYAKPCAAFAAANDGDTIEIDASGNYAGDVCAITPNNLTIKGVNGRAKIPANGQAYGGKAIWVIQGNNTTVQNIEFSGATVKDQNGAGIRQEGTNLTVSHCSFHDNEDGILAGNDANSTILIEYSEFNHNGYGDGYSHNLYINHVKKFVFQYNWSHRAKVGHLLKSRAAETDVLYNRLTGEDGTDSYEVDIPNGGKAYVIGNLIEQGTQTQNPAILTYQEEGTNAANPDHELFVVNNTFVNDKGSGTFVRVGSSVTTPAVIKNNIFQGGGTVTNQASATQANNYSGSTTCLVNAASFDYHLVAGTPCVDGGAPPGSGAGFDLTPKYQYVQPAGREGRSTVGTIDIGAYELGGGTGTGGAGGSAGSGAGGSGTGGSAAGGSAGAGTGGSATGGSGGSSGNTGGSAGNAAAGASGNGATSGDSGGCGCRAAGHDEHGAPFLVAALALFGLASAAVAERARPGQRGQRADYAAHSSRATSARSASECRSWSSSATAACSTPAGRPRANSSQRRASARASAKPSR